jgi:hypothetical protein
MRTRGRAWIVILSCAIPGELRVRSSAARADEASSDLPGSGIACSVITPNEVGLTGQPSSGNYGNGSLASSVPREGKVVFKPGGPGCVGQDGSLWMKWPWWRGVRGALRVEGRRIRVDPSVLPPECPGCPTKPQGAGTDLREERAEETLMRTLLRCVAAFLALALVPFLFMAVVVGIGVVVKGGSGPIGLEGLLGALIFFGLPLIMIFAVHRLWNLRQSGRWAALACFVLLLFVEAQASHPSLRGLALTVIPCLINLVAGNSKSLRLTERRGSPWQ